MFKYILVPATGSAADAGVFETALALARPAGAHLAFLHVQTDVNEAIAAMITGSEGIVTGLERMASDIEADVRARRERAERAVADFCSRHAIPTSAVPVPAGPSAHLVVETGDETYWLSEHGRAADLTVLGRDRDEAGDGVGIIEGVLMGTGRPVLITTGGGTPVLDGTVVLAWKDRPEAARAATAAAPVLGGAKRVLVVSVAEEGAADYDACERIAAGLRWHNAATEARHVDPEGQDAEQALLATAAAEGAGLLVMGGYSHSRLRELVFGGFTRHVIDTATIPVLMAH